MCISQTRAVRPRRKHGISLVGNITKSYYGKWCCVKWSAAGQHGEYHALSPGEGKAVVKATLKAAAERVPVIVGVNAGSTREVVKYACEVQSLGADGFCWPPRTTHVPDRGHSVDKGAH